MNKHKLPPVARLGDDFVLLNGHGITVVRRAITIAINARRRNGLPVSGEFAAMLECTTPTSHPGHSDELEHAAEHTGDREWITSADAATLLNVSSRQARRLAPELGGQIIAGRWAFDAETVRTYLAESKAI